jgi:predicted RNA-binding protein with TRAM domain
MKKMESKIPVKIGDILKLGIRGFGTDNDPLFNYKNFVIILKNYEKNSLRLNTLIEIRITKVFQHYAFAEMTNGK